MLKYLFLFFLSCFSSSASARIDYLQYHSQVILAEVLIASEKYEEALLVFEELINRYDFVFLREYKIASQVSFYLEEHEKGIEYLKKGISVGWTLKSIKKNEYIQKSVNAESWKTIKKQYPTLRKQYESKLNKDLRKKVKKLFKKDQWKAFGALFTFSSKAQDRYAEKRFASHSEKQLAALSIIFDEYGYPGEQLIGNDYWVSTILSHHNSISQNYVMKDTLFEKLKPALQSALKYGEISPFEKALMEEWRHSTFRESNRTKYGLLDKVTSTNLSQINAERKTVYLRSIETRNKLVEVEQKTGMVFYLRGTPWVEGEIVIQD